MDCVHYSDLEACGAPVDKLDVALGLDVSDGDVHVFGHNVSSVKQTASHVLA